MRLCGAICYAMFIAASSAVMELTEVDLFSKPDWQQQEVAVDGFVLGMTREQAFEVATARDLRLRSDRSPQRVRDLKGPCRDSSCSVAQVNGNWIGVNLFFGAGRVTKIRVSVPVDADSEVKQVNVARKFRGLTYQFFAWYSDDLRQRIFGPPQAKETSVQAGARASTLTVAEYAYLDSGVIIRVTTDRNDHPPTPFDLEVDFVPQVR